MNPMNWFDAVAPVMPMNSPEHGGRSAIYACFLTRPGLVSNAACPLGPMFKATDKPRKVDQMRNPSQSLVRSRLEPAEGRRSEVVVVTGASAGVGRAVVHRFAREGARIGLVARDAEALETVVREVENLGGQALALPLDVTDAEAVFAAADTVVRTFGPIDVWVNDAMATVFSPISEITPDEFRRVTEVTYLGFVHGSMAALRHMRPRGRGAIVQVGSALAYRGIPLQAAYCGAKHAIRGFNETLHSELVHEGSRVRATIVELPAVNTPQFDWARVHLPSLPRPMGAPVEPEVAADAIHHAAHGHWREYWLGRQTALVILGNFLVPGFLDRYMGRTAWKGQQTGAPVPENRQDNLFEPITALHRTSGSFRGASRPDALLAPAAVVRLGAVALGALAFFGLGRFSKGSGRR